MINYGNFKEKEIFILISKSATSNVWAGKVSKFSKWEYSREGFESLMQTVDWINEIISTESKINE